MHHTYYISIRRIIYVQVSDVLHEIDLYDYNIGNMIEYINREVFYFVH